MPGSSSSRSRSRGGVLEAAKRLQVQFAAGHVARDALKVRRATPGAHHLAIEALVFLRHRLGGGKAAPPRRRRQPQLVGQSRHHHARERPRAVGGEQHLQHVFVHGRRPQHAAGAARARPRNRRITVGELIEAAQIFVELQHRRHRGAHRLLRGARRNAHLQLMPGTNRRHDATCKARPSISVTWLSAPSSCENGGRSYQPWLRAGHAQLEAGRHRYLQT